MRYMLFAILLLVAPRAAVALMWDFDDGITWGWTAWESLSYTNVRGSLEPLQSEVVDGVWRIAPVPGRRPTIELRSPLIGKDSSLFDCLTLRLRLIHHSPTEGVFAMDWSNAEKRDLSVRGFVAGRDDQSYPIEWEEITLDLRILVARLGPVASGRLRRGGTPFLARLEGVHSARGHRQRPQRPLPSEPIIPTPSIRPQPSP